MGNRASRSQERALFSTGRLSLMLPRRSEDSTRRKSAEIKANGAEHIIRVENEKYALPTETKGINRLQIQHYLMRYLWQANFESPVKSTLQKPDSRVLDLGCGSGAWCLDLATEYPDAKITGLDIESFFPIKHEAANVDFISHNFIATKKLPFDDNTFDLVHMRFLLADIKQSDYAEIIKEVVRVTKQDAYIEILEFDVTHFADGPMTRRLTKASMSYLSKNGYNGEIANEIPQFLKKTGQVSEISEHVKSIPLGYWAKRVGEWAIQDTSSMFRDMKKQLAEELKTNEEDVDNLIENYKKEVEEKKTFFKTRRFFTQKVEPVA